MGICQENRVDATSSGAPFGANKSAVAKAVYTDMVVRCLESPLVSSRSHSSKQVTRIVTKMLIERQLDDIDQLTHFSPLITKIKNEGFPEACRVLEKGFQRLKSEYCYQHLARLYLTKGDWKMAQQYAQQAVELSPEKRDFKHTLGVVYQKMFAEKNESNCIQKLQIAFLALHNFLSAQGEESDDALSICYAYADTIEIVNKILMFVEGQIPQADIYNFGRYLTEPDFNFPLFDNEDGFREKFKSLIDNGMKALRFLYYLGYSYRYGFASVSFHSVRASRTLKYVTDNCLRQSKTFSRMLRTVHRTASATISISDEALNNAYRIENVKLMGCFFESIFQIFIASRPRGSRGRQQMQYLEEIKKNLDGISKKTNADKENTISVNLALRLAEKDHGFDRNRTQLYGMCRDIITAQEVEEVTRAKAHIYRILLSWPNVRREVFNFEHFRQSFHRWSKPLMHRNAPLGPKVLFFIARSDASFYLCHWTDIYGENDNREAMHEMARSLELFTGEYKVVQKPDAGNYYYIEMDWESVMGKLHLKIVKVRGKKVFRDARVQFYLGFSVHGPEAFIEKILSHDDGEEDK